LAFAVEACVDDDPTVVGPGGDQDVNASVNAPPEAWGEQPELDLSKLVKPRRHMALSEEGGGTVVTPSTLSATLYPGEIVGESKTLDLPDVPPKGDVLFSFDLTGSMGGELSTLKTEAVNIMNAVAAEITDVQFGLVSYMDYDGTFTTDAGGACDYYSQQYGDFENDGDVPYRLDQAITSSSTDVANEIGALVLGWGADGPESYSRVFYESYSDANIMWRDGAKRIMVNFADNIPHDCDVDALIGGTYDTGKDPGRDETIGTSDDLSIGTVLDEMDDAGITLVNLFSGHPVFDATPAGTFNELWDAYAEETGGVNYQINTDGTFPPGVDPATQIAQLITEAVSTVDEVTLEVCSDYPAYADWLVSVTPVPPGFNVDVELPAILNFDIEVGPPLDAFAGTHQFDICAVGDGAEYGRQTVTIDVLIDADQGGTVTVEEGGKPVGGIEFPPGSLPDDALVNLDFIEDGDCHNTLVGQTGRCLHVDARDLEGEPITQLLSDAVVGLCLPAGSPHHMMYRFEEPWRMAEAGELLETPEYLDCSDFTVSMSPDANPIMRFASGMLNRVKQWFVPRPLVATATISHWGFGRGGGEASIFVWAHEMQIDKSMVTLHPRQSGKDQFRVEGVFDHPEYDGFDPTTEDVTVMFDDVFEVIPGGAFTRRDDGEPDARWVYNPRRTEGKIERVEIFDDDRVKVWGARLDLPEDISFIAFGIQIGDPMVDWPDPVTIAPIDGHSTGAGLEYDDRGRLIRR
jgi:hypothetical protein